MMHFVTGVTLSRLVRGLLFSIATIVPIFLFFNDASEKIAIVDSFKSAKQPSQATWRVLIPSQLYAYSAFYALSEDRTIAKFNIVKVIAIVNRKDIAIRESMKCRCVYANKTVDAVLVDLPEHHNRSYSAATLTCNVNEMNSFARMDLHCIAENITGFLTFDMARPPWMDPKPLSFVMCGPIIFGNGTKAEHIIEFIEYYKIMGVSKYIFYLIYDSPGYSGVTEEVLMVLKYYENKGLVSLLSWDIPEEIRSQVHSNGQLAALNECRLRVAGRWDYVVIADFDEFILSSHGNGLETVVQNGFRDCVVIRQTPVKPADRIISSPAGVYKFKPRLTRYLQRDSRVWDVGDRSKYVCRAQSVLIAGIHYPHIIRLGSRILIGADPSESLLLHFREELIGKNASMTDVDMSRFLGAVRFRKFTENVGFVYDHIFKSPASGEFSRKSNVTGSSYRAFRFLLE